MLAFAVVVTSSCTVGKGQGLVKGTVSAPDCWSGSFDLGPDYFAAVPYRGSLLLRIQKGSDFENFSDGVSILIDNATAVRTTSLDEPLAVSLPPEVTPAGVPVTSQANPASVHFTLYMQRTCRVQNIALFALDGVQLDSGGGCPAIGTAPVLQCAGDAGADGGPNDAGLADAGSPVDDAAPPDGGVADAGAGDAGSPAPGLIGRSTITFHHLFDGDPDESNAAERYTDAEFDVYLADPREICPGGLGPPPPCRGHLSGNFRFYFQRGRPAQPFP